MLSSAYDEVENLFGLSGSSDTIMDLSTENIHEIREWIIRNYLYQLELFQFIRLWRKLMVWQKISTWDIFKETLIEQAEQGVDYFTIHAGVS